MKTLLIGLASLVPSSRQMSAEMHQQLDFIDLHLFEAVHGRRLADDEGTLFSTTKVDVVKSKKKTTPVSNSISTEKLKLPAGQKQCTAPRWCRLAFD